MPHVHSPGHTQIHGLLVLTRQGLSRGRAGLTFACGTQFKHQPRIITWHTIRVDTLVPRMITVTADVSTGRFVVNEPAYMCMYAFITCATQTPKHLIYLYMCFSEKSRI